MSESLCGVCTTEPKKYKCPICALPYCSLPCFKLHKATPCEPIAPSTAQAPTEPTIPQPPTPAPIPRYLKQRTDFSVLATNPKFQDLLKTYPALLPTLQRVYAATIEPDPEEEARRRRMGRGGFRGRGGRGRGRGRGGRFRDDDQGRWTQKKGDADAMKILKSVRDGEMGEQEKGSMAGFVELIEETFGKAGKDEQDG